MSSRPSATAQRSSAPDQRGPAEPGHKVQIMILASNLPGKSCGPSPERPGGYHNIHVGIQRRGQRDELLGLTPADASAAKWQFEGTLTSRGGTWDLRGPCIQGPPDGRFIYISWVTREVDGACRLFRRAKLRLGEIPEAVLGQAAASGTLVARLDLTDSKGNPVCAAVRGPGIRWSSTESAS